jgi:hypothetical protein
MSAGVWSGGRSAELRNPAPVHARVAIPRKLAQATFHESKTVAMALADGPALHRWTVVDGELALCHVIPHWPLQTKVVGGPILDWLALPADAATLKREIEAAGLPAVLAWHICIGLALEYEHVTITLDELIAAIGWIPRSTAERQGMRSRWWRWIALFESTKVIGQRPGTYRDQRTRQRFDLLSIDALLRITGRRLPAQCAFDESTPPIEVSFVAGPWLAQYRGNDQVLTYFGDVRRLAAIPAKQAGGAWAQAIGLALNQYWREQAADAEIGWVGQGAKRHQTVRFRHACTRRQLLEMFPPEPSVHAVLGSDNPSRAKAYWDRAITKLKRQRVIGYVKAIGERQDRRKGWEHEWLNQPLDIRPTAEGITPIIEIAQRKIASDRSHARRRPARAASA